jgi:hypothetical protein
LSHASKEKKRKEKKKEEKKRVEVFFFVTKKNMSKNSKEVLLNVSVKSNVERTLDRVRKGECDFCGNHPIHSHICPKCNPERNEK